MKINLGIIGACRSTNRLILALFIIILSLTGCASTAIEAHKKGVETIAQKEYFIPKKPVDRHYIGCPWSKQFGPVEDPSVGDIRIKVERSFDTMQQSFAYNLGATLGAQSTKGVTSAGGSTTGGTADSSTTGGTADSSTTGDTASLITTGGTADLGIEGGKGRMSSLENVQIISPESLADVPFELNIPYITEALRLDFAMKSGSSAKAGVTVAASSVKVSAQGAMESFGGTTGEGLVVAYKLHMIDPKTYSRQDSGSIAFELDKTTDFPQANVFVRSQLMRIEPGANKSLPINLLWSCDRAAATSKDMVAAWIIEVRPKDPKRKSLQIAFPAFPTIEDCQSFSGVIYSRIDPLTDKIIRQKINITIVQEELSDSLEPKRWEAQVSLVDESFNIKLVRQGDLGK